MYIQWDKWKGQSDLHDESILPQEPRPCIEETNQDREAKVQPVCRQVL